MVMGFVLLMLLTIAYNLAANTGQDTAVGLFLLAGAALAPFIWASAMRFRLGATRWRGLRLQFTASWKEVYIASWPVFALALVWFGVFYGLQLLSPDLAQALEAIEEEGKKQPMPRFTPAMGGLVLLGLVLSVLCVIRTEYNFKSLLVLKAQVGAERGRWKPVYMDFVKVWMATVAVFILCVVGFSALIGILAGSSIALVASQSDRLGLWMFVVIIVSIIAGIFMLILASAPARAYREARMFQLMWNNIGVSHVARFKCHLKSGRYVWLRIKNMLLTLLTLGLYRPFARVSEYRMKCESVTLHVKGGVEQVTGAMVRQQQGAWAMPWRMRLASTLSVEHVSICAPSPRPRALVRWPEQQGPARGGEPAAHAARPLLGAAPALAARARACGLCLETGGLARGLERAQTPAPRGGGSARPRQRRDRRRGRVARCPGSSGRAPRHRTTHADPLARAAGRDGRRRHWPHAVLPLRHTLGGHAAHAVCAHQLGDQRGRERAPADGQRHPEAQQADQGATRPAQGAF